MDETLESNLARRAWELLQPGDIELDGLVVSTDLANEEEPEMHQQTVKIGEVIADHAGYDPTETFVYSGTDDSEFASNQHQGLTLDDESFVWECQQLYRDGSFDIVFYFEASIDAEGLLATLRDRGFEAAYVRGDPDDPADAVGL
ncbi:DUF5778 family protein [Halovenus salina]|uniref:DUF5778 family protein n=1 Tax=Halovenus salina TaxID=1510225 RepID=UPI002260E8A6|nr:DUF5778 family protein [Halovenus salina]